MKQFIKLPKKFLELDKNTKFIDVLIYSIIDFYRDSNSDTARIGMRTIAEKYNITLLLVEQAVKRLKDNGYLAVTQLKSNKNDYCFNEYSFLVKDDVIFLNPEVLTQDLKAKDRGVLIYLQLLTKDKLTDIEKTSVSDIARQLKTARQTISKYLKYFVEIGQLTESKHYYQTKYLVNTQREEKPSKNYTFIMTDSTIRTYEYSNTNQIYL